MTDINWPFVIYFSVGGVLGCLTLLLLDWKFNIIGMIDSFRRWLGLEDVD